MTTRPRNYFKSTGPNTSLAVNTSMGSSSNAAAFKNRNLDSSFWTPLKKSNKPQRRQAPPSSARPSNLSYVEDGQASPKSQVSSYSYRQRTKSSGDSSWKVPFVLDSSKFEIVLAGLKWCQGKCIVNSISLNVREELFKEQAILLKKHGAAVVVMAFDEKGQAATEEDKVWICKRSYDTLVNEKGYPPDDIVFDPNVLTIGTGTEEHANYCKGRLC